MEICIECAVVCFYTLPMVDCSLLQSPHQSLPKLPWNFIHSQWMVVTNKIPLSKPGVQKNSKLFQPIILVHYSNHSKCAKNSGKPLVTISSWNNFILWEKELNWRMISGWSSGLNPIFFLLKYALWIFSLKAHWGWDCCRGYLGSKVASRCWDSNPRPFDSQADAMTHFIRPTYNLVGIDSILKFFFNFIKSLLCFSKFQGWCNNNTFYFTLAA